MRGHLWCLHLRYREGPVVPTANLCEMCPYDLVRDSFQIAVTVHDEPFYKTELNMARPAI
jgi:hypothetical protein